MATVWHIVALLKFSPVCRRRVGADAKTNASERINAAGLGRNHGPGTRAVRSRAVFGLVSLLYRRRAATARFGQAVTRRLKDEAGACWRLRTHLAFQPSKSSRCSAVPATPPLLHAAPPNPSLKPSPNSKTPGPRCSACHHLQRGPGVFLSVPA